MIAVDTSILVYAHREDSPFQESAYRRLKGLAEGKAAWAIPWPCLHEFLAVVTHPKIYAPPTPLRVALEQVEAWLESPTLVLLGEGPGYWDELREVMEVGRIAGPQVHDARVAALCRHHGVHELWTADRDFGRFPGIQVTNPLVQPD
ncbi:MAG: PIN domain-containing protein [Deltaproteobacteria bacterium]|nr:PIN domain-containing protein [Deltaproteobacteria bacterium]